MSGSTPPPAAPPPGWSGPPGPPGPFGSPPPGPPSSRGARWKRIVPAVLGVLVLVAAVVVIVVVLSQQADERDRDERDDPGSGESGGSEEGAGTSDGDYCAAIDELERAFDDVDPADVDLADTIELLEETGVPDDAPDGVRAGFEDYVDALRTIDGGPLDEGDEEIDRLEGEEDFQAWVEWTEETCEIDGGGDPTDSPDGGGIGSELDR